jgi:hypothetical protein
VGSPGSVVAVSRRVEVWVAALVLLVLALAPAAPALATPFGCGLAACGSSSASSAPASDDGLGLLGGSCDDHGHCADHTERTVVAALAVAVVVLLLARQNVRRAGPSAVPAPSPYAGSLFRPPRRR